MDSNKRGFSLFGNYNLNESPTDVPGKQIIIWNENVCFVFLSSLFFTIILKWHK